jgi:hypothetical protein
MTDEMTDDVLKAVPFIFVIDPSGEAKIIQNTLSNSDIARHLKFVASWIDSLPSEIGIITPGE